MDKIKKRNLFTLKNVSLKFGNLTVLKKINLSLRGHEILALVGEHGAGKSSLARIIAGFQQLTNGSLLFKGKEIKNYSTREAKTKGIEIVSQNLRLFEQFTIANNIMIDKSFSPLRFFNRKKEIKSVTTFLQGHNIDLYPESIVRNLNLSDRVMVGFLKHVYHSPNILILDETLEHLSNKHLQKVIPMLRDLKKKGSSIVFITHRIDDIYEIADRVSIMRDGKILVTEDVKDIDKINVIRLAYTQVIKEQSVSHMDFDFYKLLKYNEAVLTTLPFCLLVTDTKRKVRLINEAAKHHFGIEDTTHLDIDLKTLIGADNSAVYSLLKDSIIKKQEEYFYNIRMITNQGEYSYNISILPLFDGKLFIGNIIALEDVTEYEKLNRQLSLSENLSSIGLLAAGVAHEITNPLEIINYYMENLKLHYPDDERITEIKQEVDEEIHTISDIIENLLMFSENKKQELESVEINHLLSMIIKLLKKSSEKQNIMLTFEPDPATVYVRAAKTELKQVFLNILKNSIEAITCEGSIKVESRLKKNNGKHASVVITFIDDGPGIDNHIINNLFAPFFTTKQKPSLNMGLGLSISYNIVKKYAGNMTMRNRDGRGCETVISLPVTEGEQTRV